MKVSDHVHPSMVLVEILVLLPTTARYQFQKGIPSNDFTATSARIGTIPSAQKDYGQSDSQRFVLCVY